GQPLFGGHASLPRHGVIGAKDEGHAVHEKDASSAGGFRNQRRLGRGRSRGFNRFQRRFFSGRQDTSLTRARRLATRQELILRGVRAFHRGDRQDFAKVAERATEWLDERKALTAAVRTDFRLVNGSHRRGRRDREAKAGLA